MKHINIICLKNEDGELVGAPERLMDTNFTSYAGVAHQLKAGQTAVVAVSKGTELFTQLLGYGEVSKNQDGSYTQPTRLLPCY